MNTNYKPYINPARTEARQEGKDTFDETGYTIGEPMEAVLGFWGDDTVGIYEDNFYNGNSICHDATE